MSTGRSARRVGGAQEADAMTRAGQDAFSAEGASRRLTLEEKTAELRVRRRDCRSCKAFRPDPSGMSFGWCTAFEQFVKLYHPAGEFWSQCQFKVIARTPLDQTHRGTEVTAAERAPAAAAPGWRPVPAPE